MRLSIFALCLALSNSFAAQPEVVPNDAGPLNPSAAEAGKDVVHQLNNAFAKVFETVAPGVVIIETSKKSEISESSPLDDLFFKGRRMKTGRAGVPARRDRFKVKAPASLCGPMATSSRTCT